MDSIEPNQCLPPILRTILSSMNFHDLGFVACRGLLQGLLNIISRKYMVAILGPTNGARQRGKRQPEEENNPGGESLHCAAIILSDTRSTSAFSETGKAAKGS